MSSQDAHPYSNADSSRRGFAELYIFLRDAFQQRGLVSIPPEILQLFRQCPLQDIECPDIAAFAKLFEGTRSSNRFRLEANSFIYTVQMLFHLRPNLIQERVLHSLMISVRLLKDENGATQQLSELAGREIDRYVVAKKRATISTKLIPWLLKHFSQDSTITRLKIIAAQFLFHLLQGDEEAKTILGSCPQKERWSLGRSISTSPHFSLRILAANLVREVSLADIDILLFWPSGLLEGDEPRLPSSFLADYQWLRDTISYLRGVDGRRARPDEREKTHEILSLRAGSLAFSDANSKMLVTIAEPLLFIVPANQNRPLEILEIPLIASMEYDKSDSTISGHDTLGREVELRLHLRNTGFYIFNGFKSAIDVVHLGFESHDDCDAFCHTLVIALQNIPTGLQTLTSRQSDEEIVGGKEPRPKKQSRAIMIDLSQDDIISGDTQPFSYSLQAPGRVFTSQYIDMSRSTDSSMSPMSPLRPIAEVKAAPLQPGEDERSLPGTQQVQPSLSQEEAREVQLTPDNAESAEVGDKIRAQANTKELPTESVATTYPESTSQEKAVRNTAEGPLPHQIQQHDLAETSTISPVATSTLQNLALDALQHALKSPITATAAPLGQPEEGDHLSTVAQITTGSPRPPPASALANSGTTMAAKTDSSRQTASTTLRKPRKQNGGSERKTNGELQNSLSAETSLAEEAAVDWDEDLRAVEGEEMNQSKPPRTSKASASRGARSGPKKSAGTRTVPKPPAARRKGQKKDRVKENKPKAATARATLATTRPRRTAASVSYGEQSEQEDHSEGSVVETNEPVGLAGSDKSSPSTNNAQTHRKTISLDGQHVDDVSDSLAAGPPQPVLPPEAVVELSRSSEALSAAVKPITQPDTEQVEGEAPGPDRESTCGQEDKPEHRIPELPENAQVEAVEDSHPLDKKQRAEAINRARKSFGSGLLDAIDEKGMQLIQAPNIDPAMKKPFGDKIAFVDSVKSALKQGSRKSQPQTSRSGKRKHVETPSLGKQGTDSEPQRTAPNDDRQSARVSKRSRIPTERSPSYEQVESGGLTFLPQNTDAASPRAVSDRQKGSTEALSSPHGKESVSHPTSPSRDHSSQANSTRVALLGFATSIARPELPAKADAPAQILLSNSHTSIARLEPFVEADNHAPTLLLQSQATNAMSKSAEYAGSPAPNLPSNSPTWTAKQKPSIKTGGPAAGLQPGGKSAITHHHSRKRSPFPESDKPQQAKKARKTDPGPIREQMNDGRMQNPLLSSQQTENGPTRDPTRKPRNSEPTARISSKAESNEEQSTMPWMQYKSKPIRTSNVRMGRSGANASKSPLKLMQIKTPRRHGLIGKPPQLTDDPLQHEAQIVGFSAQGPQNQGVLSSGKQDDRLEHSSPVPSETGKHLAFKSLHTESTAAGKPATAVPNPFGPFGRLSQRQVELSISDGESADDGTHVDEESGEDGVRAPATADVESSKNTSQNSNVDLNGSPRPHLRETFRESQQSNNVSVLEISRDVNENSDITSVFKSHDSEELESHNSTDFGLKSAVSDYTAANARAIAKKKKSRGMPSIGVGELLNRIFPHANESIETNAFKSWNPSVTTKAPDLSNSVAQFNHGRDADEKAVYQSLPNEMNPIGSTEAPWFDIEQLNVSVADGKSGSIVSARVRRLRSTTPPSPNREAPEPNDSPPSFNTRLGKMIMPPPSRKEATKADAVKEYEIELHRRRELSALMDAETTLVNGEASEAETNLLPPQGPQRSSPSSSGDEDGTPVPALQKLPIQAINHDRRMWNQKVSQTQQTIKEILEQVSQKLLLRFSSAEQGIKFKLDHYHYGGWKILNNLVEQFDARVGQEKEMPSARMSEYSNRVGDAINRLQRAKNQTRSGPSLDDLEKSRRKRTEYVLVNLEKFAAAQSCE